MIFYSFFLSSILCIITTQNVAANASVKENNTKSSSKDYVLPSKVNDVAALKTRRDLDLIVESITNVDGNKKNSASNVDTQNNKAVTPTQVVVNDNKPQKNDDKAKTKEIKAKSITNVDGNKKNSASNVDTQNNKAVTPTQVVVSNTNVPEQGSNNNNDEQNLENEVTQSNVIRPISSNVFYSNDQKMRYINDAMKALSNNKLDELKMIIENTDPEIWNHKAANDTVFLSMLLLQNKSFLEPLIKLLLERGVDPNIPDIAGATPLHIASRLNQIAIVKLLVQYGASINDLDVFGYSSLMRAVESCNSAVVMYLIRVHTQRNISYRVSNRQIVDLAMHCPKPLVLALSTRFNT